MSLVLPAFFGGGIGLAAGALLLLILRLTPSARLKARLSGLVVARKPGITAKKKEEGGGRRFIVPTLGGAVFSGLIAGRMPYMLAAVPVGAALGFLAGKLAVKLYRSRTHFQRLREAAVLYESIDLFTRAGFTPRQAMELSLPLLTLLRPAVERCIASWSGGALRAIEQLGNDINLKEADVLIAVLMQIVEGGGETHGGNGRRSASPGRTAAEPRRNADRGQACLLDGVHLPAGSRAGGDAAGAPGLQGHQHDQQFACWLNFKEEVFLTCLKALSSF